MLSIYDSLRRTKVRLQPLAPGKIGIYACGVTVYDACHLGHARTSVAVDCLVRYLRSVLGLEVKYVRNITDVDDKIIQKAAELGCSTEALTQLMGEAMQKDFKALNFLSPDAEPKATEYIGAMQAMIACLLEKGFAYLAPSGDVYFRVARAPNYGELSGQKREALHQALRVSGSHKESMGDFVLWKSVTDGSQPVWDSPWGAGRPGWHIECSAMSKALLGPTMDIHAGGCDLKFPHHENERAQSSCANDAPLANIWMHIGMVTVNGEKMSKSLGNFVELHKLNEAFKGEVVRYFLLQSHYRKPLDFTPNKLALAQRRLERLYGALLGLPLQPLKPSELVSKQAKAFFEALQDDLNTPLALTALSTLVAEVFKLKKEKHWEAAAQAASELSTLASLLGCLEQAPESYFQSQPPVDLEAKIEARNQARLAGDWALADRIREELANYGIQLQDGAEGSTWTAKTGLKPR